MKFKEWFKNDTEKAKVAGLKNGIERNLSSHEQSQLESLDPEFQEWLLYKYPKTNDDTFANDKALDFMINNKAYEAFDDEENSNNKELEKTSEAMIYNLGDRAAELADKKDELLDKNHQLFILERRIKEKKEMAALQAKSAFGTQDKDFHWNEFAQADAETLVLINEFKTLEQEVQNLESKVADMQSRYDAAMDRYYAFTGKLDPDLQSDTETNN